MSVNTWYLKHEIAQGLAQTSLPNHLSRCLFDLSLGCLKAKPSSMYSNPNTCFYPPPALPTASSISSGDSATAQTKPWESHFTFFSPPTSSLSGNPVGSAFKTYPESNRNTSHHLHCYHPGQSRYELFLAWVVTAIASEISLASTSSHPNPSPPSPVYFSTQEPDGFF